MSVWTTRPARAGAGGRGVGRSGVGRRAEAAVPEVEHLLDRLVVNIEHGRFERSLSGLTAVAAVVTAVEIYLEHYKASFGNKWMWSPILVTPPVVIAGIAGVYSRRWAKTALPIASAVFAIDGLLGEYFHARGVARKPGGWRLASYNVPTGPPISAPGLMAMVGGMGVLAAVLRRER
ncbi:hypothetical protein [Pseudactinotalea sp. HY160]|uniref:hypothetical protein n=1 Tax=Pseudactinotalea sp. HY160 TaxID=2654490 RepID=UPI001D15D470|nr:hypothetical protein [Pseudactinotalea sp. HY160]